MNNLAGGTKIPPYRIIDLLGQGGFGITYLSYDEQLERCVVIKEHFPNDICRRDLDSGFVVPIEGQESRYEASLDSFLKESQILASLSHSQIPAIFDIFECNNTAYSVLSYISGENLRQWCERYDNERVFLPLILKSLLHLLSWLHKRDILHRDIKPDNIIISANKEVSLIDFGAACYRSGLLDATCYFSPVYSPPEQNEGSLYGYWSDLYSLAKSFHIIIEESEKKDQEGKVVYPCFFRESIEKALSLEIKNRFQSADEWLKFLSSSNGATKRLITRMIIVFLTIGLFLLLGGTVFIRLSEWRQEPLVEESPGRITQMTIIEEERKTILAPVDKTIDLDVRDAMLTDCILNREVDPIDIGYMGKIGSKAEWDISLEQSGRYALELNYATPNYLKSSVEIRCGDSLFVWKCEGTGRGDAAWGIFKTGKIAVVYLPEGKTTLAIRTRRFNRSITIRHARLIPYNEETVELIGDIEEP